MDCSIAILEFDPHHQLFLKLFWLTILSILPRSRHSCLHHQFNHSNLLQNRQNTSQIVPAFLFWRELILGESRKANGIDISL
jgi:hypothetical protein